MSGTALPGETVVRRSSRGWVVGDEETADLTSAMVLADLLAADLESAGSAEAVPAGAPGSAAVPADPARPRQAKPPRHAGASRDEDEAARLAVTVAQLEHALTARVRVEQAIGVLAERHRLRTRQAFDLLRGAARARGLRVIEVANDVVNSATNPLLRLPEELARKTEPYRPRPRSSRRRSRTAI
ncbi:MAG TPA: ANTAR domain-containing protein [Streptosporangiaceae bacterium]|nr:ANTAR domain-containing protein [Streptosporangiaceae bacterium]